MKRASSLNVLNVGGKAAEDHFQVRIPAPPHALNSPDQAGGLAADPARAPLPFLQSLVNTVVFLALRQASP